jgi:hypothetical protein
LGINKNQPPEVEKAARCVYGNFFQDAVHFRKETMHKYVNFDFSCSFDKMLRNFTDNLDLRLKIRLKQKLFLRIRMI